MSNSKDLLKKKKERDEHNVSIMKINPKIEQGTLPGNIMLVRLFKFEFETETEGGLIVPKFKNYETDGGRWASKIDQLVWQARGVVVKHGTKMEDEDKEQMPVGSIVWVPLSTLASGREFYDERETPAAVYDGYSRILPGAVEFIEYVPKEEK